MLIDQIKITKEQENIRWKGQIIRTNKEWISEIRQASFKTKNQGMWSGYIKKWIRSKYNKK